MNSRRFARVRQRPRHKPGEMNKLEERYAAILAARQAAGEIDAYWFERFTFKLADDTRYTPDFVVQMPDGTLEAHEVKARANKPARKVNGVKVRPLGTRPLVEDDARVKIKVFAEMFPFRCVVAFSGGASDSWSFEEVGA